MKRTGKTVLSRRTLLRGLLHGSAVSVGVPTLEAMLDGSGRAFASGAPLPRRFGLWWFGDGVRLKQWNPAAQGRGDAWALSEELAPLADVKPWLTVVSGTALDQGGHQHGCSLMQTGTYTRFYAGSGAFRLGTAQGPSVDQLIAQEIGAGDPIPSLQVGVCNNTNKGEGPVFRAVSHAGDNAPLYPLYTPVKLFNRLFGTDFLPPPSDPKRATRLRWEKSVLDAVAQDRQALRPLLGAGDNQRLDQHFEAIRALERRITSAGAIEACARRDPPAATEAGGNNEQLLVANNMAIAELLALALVCRQTKVFTHMFSGAVDGTVYRWLEATKGHHGVTHDEPGEQPIVHRSVIWKMERLAELGRALRDVPEGAGTLLDNCCILVTSDVCEGRSHGRRDMPMLVLGRAGGALRGDLHYRSASAEHSLRVHVTLFRALGLRLDAFGTGAARQTSPIPALLA